MENDTISIKTEFKINEIDYIDERIKQLENVIKGLKDDKRWTANYSLSNEIISQANIQHLELEIKTLKSIRNKVMLVDQFLLEYKVKKDFFDQTYQISQGSLNFIEDSISCHQQFLEKIKKLPEKATFVKIEKSQLILELETTLSFLKQMKKETENKQ